jgi:secondary thiamine-phosphate synthase enzyme
VQGGGCSGFQDGLVLAEVADGDPVSETAGIKVIVDPKSMRYLEGAGAGTTTEVSPGGPASGRRRGPGVTAPPLAAPMRLPRQTYMSAIKTAARPGTEAGLATVRVVTETLRLATDKRLELYNLTEKVKVADIVKRHDIKDGLVLLSSLHTTVALFVNEWQSALLHDIKGMLNKVVSPRDEWQHNDPEPTLLGHALSFQVAKGKLVLGQFQAIIAAELDGPRNRDLAVQIIGY